MDLMLLTEELDKRYRSVIYDEVKGTIRTFNGVYVDISWITGFNIYDDRVEIDMRNGNKAIFYINGAYKLIMLQNKEVDNMVDRTEAKSFDEFTGKVHKISYEQAKSDDRQPQYHIEIEPQDVEIKGKTGLMHEWIRVPSTSTQTSVPQGSVIDAYIRALERLDKKVKDIKSVEDALLWMKGKTFRFTKEVLGKSYGTYPASAYWVPVQLV